MPRVVSFYLVQICCAFLAMVSVVQSWQWSDWVAGGGSNAFELFSSYSSEDFLTIHQVSDLRVREIKRRLARNHGFSAEELGRMLDKKELIQALAFEEEKLRLAQEDEIKRALLKQGAIFTVIAVAVVLCWPLLRHAYEVAMVNFVVYTDRKRHEASRCWELRSYKAMVGITLMFFIDVLQSWMTLSIILSWVMTSKYFFPVPSLPVRPAQLMGGEIGRSSLSNYGVNISPMVISWLFRFLNGRFEAWTGRAMSQAMSAQRKAARQNETKEERAARKEARRQAKRRAQEEEAARAAAAAAYTAPSAPVSNLHPDWMNPVESNVPTGHETDAGHATFPASAAHEEFIQQVENHSSEFDDLD